MSFEIIIFYLFATVLILSAGYMVFTKNVLYAAFALLATLLSLAAIYVFLYADFLAITQIMVYVGGVLVLILFGIMLSNKVRTSALISETVNKKVGIFIGTVLFFAITYIVFNSRFALGQDVASESRAALLHSGGTLKQVGINLMTKFVLPFEIASGILLAALMGAAFISTDTKKK